MEHGFQKNLSTYLTNKAHIFDFETLMTGPRGEVDVTTQLRNIFDKSDLTSDSFRKSDMHIFNNETLMQRHPHLQALKHDISQDQLKSVLLSGVQVCVLYGDFYSTQENVPFGIADRT